MNQQTYQPHAKVGTWGEVIILVCQDKISKTSLRSLSQRETTWYENDHITNRWKNSGEKAKKEKKKKTFSPKGSFSQQKEDQGSIY